MIAVGSGRAPAPGAADVGIVAALAIELGPLLKRLRRSRRYSVAKATIVEGELGGKLVVAVIGGAGKVAALKAGELLLMGHRPRWVLSAGFAGALDSSIARNDLLLANEVIDADRKLWSIDLKVGADSGSRDLREPGRRTLTGRLLTVDSVVRTAAEKLELGARYGAVAVDMESAAVAALCADRDIRFVSIRVISDDAATDLPPEVLAILGQSAGYRAGAAFAAILNRRESLGELLRLREHARSAARRLAPAIEQIIAAL